MRTLPTIVLHAPEGRHANESEIVDVLRDDGYPVEIVREMPQLLDRLERVRAPERVIAMADVLSMMAHRADIDGRRRSVKALHDIMQRPMSKRMISLILVEPRSEDTDVFCSDGHFVAAYLKAPLDIDVLRRFLGYLYDFVTGRTDMEKVRLKDQFRGCMVGMAVGDALGAASEFMTEGQVRQAYGVLHDYRATSFFGVGEFTDDTSMALAIAESIIEADDVDIEDIAERFILWRKTDGRGIGILTDQVLRLIEDGMAPREASRKAWEASGRQSAGNGAVMRCAPVALYEWLDCTCRSIEDVCRITHYDSRCVASCAAVSKAISEMLHGESNPVRALYAGQLGIRGELYDALDAASTENVESMRLDGPDQGYTILTTRAAFAALRQFDNFEDGIVAVVNKGGDADTNACVAGALLGTRLGLSAIPERWVQGLVDLDRVLTAADGLYDLAVV